MNSTEPKRGSASELTQLLCRMREVSKRMKSNPMETEIDRMRALNDAAWLGERVDVLIAEIERLQAA